VSWRSYARKLGKPEKPRQCVIKRAQYDAWAKRKQRRQAVLGGAVILVLASVVAVLMAEFWWQLLR